MNDSQYSATSLICIVWYDACRNFIVTEEHTLSEKNCKVPIGIRSLDLSRCMFGLNFRFMIMVFNATFSFSNISVVLWRSVLLVEETGEKPSTCRKSLSDKLYRIICCIECALPWTVFKLIILVVIGTDCTEEAVN